jgi:hypothetical protein
MEVENDASYLNLEGAYILIKNREFIHTLAYDPDLL